MTTLSLKKLHFILLLTVFFVGIIFFAGYSFFAVSSIQLFAQESPSEETSNREISNNNTSNGEISLESVPEGTQTISQGRPNILFLFVDDLNADALSFRKNPVVQTPTIDRLAQEGVSFSNAYNQGGWHGAVCMASRSMLHSGQNLWKAQNLFADQKKVAQAVSDRQFWSLQLKNQGYETWFTGKWHSSVDVKKLFDHVSKVSGGMLNDTPSAYNRPLENQPDSWSPTDRSQGGFWKKNGKHWSEIQADETIRMLKEASQSEKPFFICASFNAPHDPRQAPQEYLDRYPLETIDIPLNFSPEYPFKKEIGCPPSLRDEHLAPFPRTEFAVRTHRREYYASISFLDEQLGRILKTLDELSPKNSTLIVFAADNGLSVGGHGLLGKQSMFEHSVRVPLIFCGLDLPKNKTIDIPVYMQDLVPTTLELTGALPQYRNSDNINSDNINSAEIKSAVNDLSKKNLTENKPEDLSIADGEMTVLSGANGSFCTDFRSLCPLMQGKTNSVYDGIYGAYMKSQRMIRVGNWKMILYPDAGVKLLFDLKSDPLETRNLATVGKNLPQMKAMFAQFLEEQRRTGDTLDLRSVFPELCE